MATAVAEPTAADKVSEELDTIEARTDNKDWTFNDGDVARTYTQKPLGFFHKVEFFSLIGETLEAMADSDRPLNINEVFSAQADMDNLVSVVARIASHAPETLKEAYCIALAIPRGEREWAKWVMDSQLTDEEGFEIMERFIDQNGDAMRDFFASKGSKLLKRVMTKFGRSESASAEPAPSSKPSKRTRQSTEA